MNSSARCPCCSGKLIHHISLQRDYWFCRNCWQEMPAMNVKLKAIDKLKKKPNKAIL